MSRIRHGAACTIVIKLGTSSIVHEKTHQPLLSTLSAIVETVVHLRSVGHKVVLVSSGAIGVGLKRMNLPSRPKSLSGKQALAAIGQGRLIALWDNLFGQVDQPIAQVLLTRGDISDRTRYLNAVNTFKELLSMGVVPIVNENDTVSVSEIKFGDNDTLSAITSSMINADYLFLLTDVESLYTANPRKDPTATAIEVVHSVTDIREQVSTNTLGSSLGTGGMETKLIAAEIATAAGVTTVIASSKYPENIFSIIEYNQALLTEQPRLGQPDATPMSAPTMLPITRPPHTLFTPSPTPMRDVKSWTRHTLSPAGSVIIDGGAYRVLSRKESGGRLLPAGVVGVVGAFASGQAVRIVIRREEGPFKLTTEEEKAAEASYIDGFEETQPNTPNLYPAASMSSSIVSLPPLSSSIEALVRLEDKTPSISSTPLPEDDIVLVEKEGETEADVLEVGRGLANYNSVQILRVKGLNSSKVPQLLGYADSEYVVENITISIPP